MRARRVATALAAALLTVSGVSGCGSGGSSSSARPTPSQGSSGTTSAGAGPAAAFLSAYVTDDGRVLRHDQGDDVVSEGQAYGMLIAEYAGRADVARTIWSWTRAHLARGDGLLAYHASADGSVLDRQAASDADTLAAYALLSYDGPDAGSLHEQGKQLADAVLAHETVRDPGVGPVLVAGPWARSGAVVDPSYWMPGVFEGLSRLTGDHTWSQLASSSVRLVGEAAAGGHRLPPDWGTLDHGRLVPTGQGGGSGTPQYGPDAQRVPLWFAASCDDPARKLAAGWWPVLQQGSSSASTSLNLDGSPLDGSAATIALLASAASAHAAGDDGGAENLRRGAEQSDQGSPTYYGSAWLALSQALRDGRLGACG